MRKVGVVHAFAWRLPRPGRGKRGALTLLLLVRLAPSPNRSPSLLPFDP